MAMQRQLLPMFPELTHEVTQRFACHPRAQIGRLTHDVGRTRMLVRTKFKRRESLQIEEISHLRSELWRPLNGLLYHRGSFNCRRSSLSMSAACASSWACLRVSFRRHRLIPASVNAEFDRSISLIVYSPCFQALVYLCKNILALLTMMQTAYKSVRRPVPLQ